MQASGLHWQQTDLIKLSMKLPTSHVTMLQSDQQRNVLKRFNCKTGGDTNDLNAGILSISLCTPFFT